MNSFLWQARKQLKNVFTESSGPVKIILVTSLLCFPLGLSFSSIITKIFALRPNIVLPPKFWIWTILTYPFAEQEILGLLLGLTAVVVASKLLEPLWGSTELCKFMVISWTSAGLMSALVYLAIYIFTLNENFLYNSNFYGLAAVQGAVLVGLKQTRGEDFLVKTPYLTFQLNSLPILCAAVVWFLDSLSSVFSMQYATLLTTGMYCSWFYLRFLQHHQRGRGDLADHFTLASFFPRPINRFVKVASLPCWQLAVRFGFCKKQVGGSTGGRQGYMPVNLNLPDVDTFDAERKRQKALQQLNDRLQKTDNMPTENVENEIPTEVVVEKPVNTENETVEG